MGGRRARAKVAPTPAVLPHTTQPSQTAQPSPSNWIRAAFATTIIAIAIPFAGWFSEHYGATLPNVYPLYESQTAQHSLMVETAKRPGVHAFYAEAGMGKTTVAKAVLRELHHQNVPAAFVKFETPGQLKLEVVTALQTNQLSHDLHGALLQLKDRGFRKAVLVIDAVDEHELTREDEETIKALAGVSWELLDDGIEFAVICLIRRLETKKRFAQMNGGHKITGGLAAEACPNVSTETLRSYASQLNATGDFEKWTKEAPYLIVVRRFAEGHSQHGEIVQHFKELCSGVIVHELAGSTEPKPVWVRQLQEDRAGGFKFAGNAFKVIGAATDIDELKKAIKKEKPNKVLCDPDEMDIYSREDGRWKKVEKMGARLQDTDDDNPYGYILP